MLLATAPTTEGHPIKQYLGIVVGETIIGADTVKDFVVGLTNLPGGRSTTCEKILIKGKGIVLKELQQRAAALGASAIVGIDLDYKTAGADEGVLMITASGTATQV